VIEPVYTGLESFTENHIRFALRQEMRAKGGIGKWARGKNRSRIAPSIKSFLDGHPLTPDICEYFGLRKAKVYFEGIDLPGTVEPANFLAFAEPTGPKMTHDAVVASLK